VLDLGTGGGFPGIPLAIVHPQTHFDLIDGSGKKIGIVKKVIEALGLTNVQAFAHRSEVHSGKYHTIVCRAVADTRQILKVTRHLCMDQTNYLLLKGGDLGEELSFLTSREYHIWPIRDFFPEPFFETKQVIEIKR
jgi:16S rRNA (guanine527-N7)-methyltransferase